MSSVDAAPQLSPVRQFEPLNMSSPYRGASMEEEIEWRMRRVKTTTTLESGAPETPEEASLSQPATPPHRSPASKPVSSKLTAERLMSKLECVSEDAEEEEEEEELKNASSPRFEAQDKVRDYPTFALNYIQPAPAPIVSDSSRHEAECVPEQKSKESAKLPAVIQSHLDKEKNFQEAVDVIEPKIINAPETVTKEDADLLHSREVRAHGVVEKGGITAQAQSLAAKNEKVNAAKEEKSHAAKEANFQEAVGIVEPKIANVPETVTEEDADLLHSREVRAHGETEKGRVTAFAQSLAAKNEQQSEETTK